MEKALKYRNAVARFCGQVNKPKVIPAKKGKGSFRRMKKVSTHGY
jgi:hypothetical protein